jgi:hypothetical protein
MMRGISVKVKLSDANNCVSLITYLALSLIINSSWVQKQYSAKVSKVDKYLWMCLLAAQQSTKLLMPSISVPVDGPQLLANSSRPTKLPLLLQGQGQENGHSGSSYGSMNSEKHSRGEIGELKDSPKWNRGYYAFLQKLPTPFKVARVEMHKWWNRNKWRVAAASFTMDIWFFFLVPKMLFEISSSNMAS